MYREGSHPRLHLTDIFLQVHDAEETRLSTPKEISMPFFPPFTEMSK